jgi:DNA-binding NarL/FixJ family response regulator
MIVDDHPAVRRGLRELLEGQAGFSVLEVVGSAEEAVALAAQGGLDVAIVDYQLGGRNGLWLTRKLKRLPKPPKVVIYSGYSDPLLTAAAVVSQADGLVSKAGLGSELIEAIRAVACGHAVLPMHDWDVAGVIRRRLDDRELAIYGMLLAGISSQEIAGMLRVPVTDLQAVTSRMVGKLEF